MDGEEGYFFKPLPGRPVSEGAQGANLSASGSMVSPTTTLNNSTRNSPHAARPPVGVGARDSAKHSPQSGGEASFPPFPSSLSCSQSSPRSNYPTRSPPGKTRILPLGQGIGLFPTAFPTLLHYRITGTTHALIVVLVRVDGECGPEKEWQDVIKKVNELWSPVVDESKRLTSQVGVIGMTLLSVPLTYAKEHKFRSALKEARKLITIYLSHVRAHTRPFRCHAAECKWLAIQINKLLEDKSITFEFIKMTEKEELCYCLEIEAKSS